MIAERDDDSSISTSTSEQYGVKMAFVLADALHCLATLLLEIVATNTVLPSSRTIRMHWRSACKLWLNCIQVCPSHAMAKKQIEKLLAYGCYDFIKIGVDNDLPKVAYNTNINMIKFGVGHRFK